MAYRGDFTATNAFFWSSAEDLSIYSGHDLGNTPFLLTLTDGAGKEATGYIGAVGTGETLGSEKLPDPGFDNPGTWTSRVGWSVAESLAVANPSSDSIYCPPGGFTVGQLVKTSVVLNVLTSGKFAVLNFSYAGAHISVSGSDYKTANATASQFGMIGYALTGSFSSISTKVVLDPPSTAVHIVSSLNGTTRDWASIESGFDPNTIASWAVTKQFERDSLRSSQMYLLL